MLVVVIMARNSFCNLFWTSLRTQNPATENTCCHIFHPDVLIETGRHQEPLAARPLAATGPQGLCSDWRNMAYKVPRSFAVLRLTPLFWLVPKHVCDLS